MELWTFYYIVKAQKCSYLIYVDLAGVWDILKKISINSSMLKTLIFYSRMVEKLRWSHYQTYYRLQIYELFEKVRAWKLNLIFIPTLSTIQENNSKRLYNLFEIPLLSKSLFDSFFAFQYLYFLLSINFNITYK